MSDRIDAHNFAKQVGEACTKAQFEMLADVWGFGDKSQQQEGQKQRKGDSTNPFLKPLVAGMGVIGEMQWKQIENDMNQALRKTNIYT